MQQVQVKKVYVAPKVAELGNVSALTLCLVGGSQSVPFTKHKHLA
jgi:hypothetical protein